MLWSRLGRGVALLVLALVWLGCVKQEEALPPPSTVVWPAVGDVPSLQLPAGVTPTLQRIELTIDPAASRYTGRTEIEVELAAPSSVLWLHGRALDVGKAVVVVGSRSLQALYGEHGETGFASVRTSSPIPAGKARVLLSFEGALEQGTRLGVYRLLLDGRSYVFTQLEPIAARTVFPCFDEPGFKIPFEISLVVPRGQTAVSNGRELSRTPKGVRDRVAFAPTQKLPSYALAFAVGELDVAEIAPAPPSALRPTSVPMRLFAIHGHAAPRVRGVDQVAGLLAAHEAYSGVAYPYEKLDLIAVPDKNGAMENPGAITIDEDYLLPPASEAERLASIDTISHELAHMWAGNLVTLAWWDDVWLNEGMATWMATKATHAVVPELDVDSLRRSYVEENLRKDGATSTRAIREPIRTNEDIAAAFDRMVYEKGAAVLAMIERWAGEESFQRGLQAYWKKYQHGTATLRDLIAELDAATGKPVSEALGSFLNNRGAPLVTATLRCEPDKAYVDLRQAKLSAASADAPWTIPVCVAYGGKLEGEACKLLSASESVLELPASAGCPDWAIPNIRGDGYYRVALTDRERQRLRIRGLELLPAHARRAYAATVAREYQRGAIPFAEALDTLAERAADDTELLGAATDLLLDAKAILGPAFHDKIERHARRLCGTQLARVGRDALANEPRERAVLRREVIRCLTLAGRDRELRLEARQRARTHFERAADAAPTSFGAFEEVAMQVLGEDGEPADFDRLLGLAGGSDSRRERAKTALAFAQDATLVDGLQAPPRTEDRVAILHQRFAVAHLAGANWDWLASNDGAVLRELMAWEGWPLRVVERLCDARRLAQAEASLPPLGRTPKQSETIQAALAQARACAGPRASHEAEMRAYFTTR